MQNIFGCWLFSVSVVVVVVDDVAAIGLNAFHINHYELVVENVVSMFATGLFQCYAITFARKCTVFTEYDSGHAI